VAVISAGTFTYREAFEEHCFVQLPLLRLDGFLKGADRRGLMRWTQFDPAAWETLDREELLPPVAYALHGLFDGVELTAIEQAWMIVRDDSGHVPWSELRQRSEDLGGIGFFPIYSQWQYLTLAEVERHLRPSYALKSLKDGLDAHYESLRRIANAPRDTDQLRRVAAGQRVLELELTRVSTTLRPVVRHGKYHGRHGDVEGGDGYEFTREEQRRFDYAAEATRCGLDVQRLVKRYEFYAHHGDRLDPVSDWFYLVDQLDRNHQEAVTGDALQARDHYDAAELMRLWHAQIADAPLPRLDEPRHGWGAAQAKVNLFGTRDIYRNREALPAILEHYGLYPWRVQLVVEGPSDARALRTLLRAWGMSFERLGIRVVEGRGSGLPKNVDQLLADVRGYANYYLLVFDNEGNAPALVEKLLAAGVIEGFSEDQTKTALESAAERAKRRGGADPKERAKALREERELALRLEGGRPGEAPEFFIWEKDMEADNFELVEICDVVERHARETIPGFALDREQIADELRIESKKKRGKGIAEIVLAAAEQSAPPLRLDEGKKTLAELLMAYALEHPDFRGETRPITDLAEHLVRLTGPHRQLRGQLRGPRSS
jgi:hypothetical protein